MITLLDAPCGINCGDCDAYIATQTDNQELMQQMADSFLKNHGKTISLDELKCDGCMAGGKQIGFCARCEIRSCAVGKGYQTCAECADFPCEIGSFIWTTNSKSKARLEEQRKD
jgi:hypothetical protein